MNLDLLIKLVKLANNNPSDNEANLAARKVCKMIAEADYKFGSAPPVKPMPMNDNFDQVRKYYEEMMNSRPKYNPTPRQEEYYKKKDNYYYYGTDWGSNPFTREEPRRQSRTSTCTKCGVILDTFNLKEPFVCFICDYGEKRP